jgi:VanZ family protein
MGLIFFVSSLSLRGTRLPQNSDKVIHFAEYGVLAALLTFGFRRHLPAWAARRAAAWTWVVAAAYGASDELHQLFVPNRSCSLYDWVADATGAALAAGLLVVLWQKKETALGHDPALPRQEP